MFITTLICALALLITFLLIRLNNFKKCFPPGPRGLPVLGNLLDLGGSKNPFLVLEQWAREYNNFFTLWFLWKPVVVCGNDKSIREVLVTKSNEFAGRPFIFRFRYLMKFKMDIAGRDCSPSWIAAKKLFMNSVKMYGERLSYLEEITMDFLKGYIVDLERLNGNPTYPEPHFHALLTDIIASIGFGRKIEKEAQTAYRKIDKDFARCVSPVSPGGEIDLFPILHHIPSKAMTNLTDLRDRLDQWILVEIQKTKALYEPGNPKCVLDAFWEEQSKAGVPLPAHLTDDTIHAMGTDLILAGIATSSGALNNMIALMAAHQDVQRKLQAEIDKVIGQRWVTLEDRNHLHYTEAVIMETLRYTGLVPVSSQHCPIKDETLCGYKIPKSTEMWIFLWRLHHSEEYWTDPMTFNPDRFIENGEIVHPEHPNRRRFLTFGAGRRVCPGEVLARNRLALITTSIFQRFNVLPVEGDPPLPVDPIKYEPSIVIEAPPYRVRFESRT